MPPEGCETRDDEDALCALYRNNFDIEKAKNSFPFPHINAPFRTVRPDALGFDEEEVKIFEESLEKYGKDFPLIRRLRVRDKHFPFHSFNLSNSSYHTAKLES